VPVTQLVTLGAHRPTVAKRTEAAVDPYPPCGRASLDRVTPEGGSSVKPTRTHGSSGRSCPVADRAPLLPAGTLGKVQKPVSRASGSPTESGSSPSLRSERSCLPAAQGRGRDHWPAGTARAPVGFNHADLRGDGGHAGADLAGGAGVRDVRTGARTRAQRYGA